MPTYYQRTINTKLWQLLVTQHLVLMVLIASHMFNTDIVHKNEKSWRSKCTCCKNSRSSFVNSWFKEANFHMKTFFELKIISRFFCQFQNSKYSSLSIAFLKWQTANDKFYWYHETLRPETLLIVCENRIECNVISCTFIIWELHSNDSVIFYDIYDIYDILIVCLLIQYPHQPC